MARKNGCPFSVRDYNVEIMSHATTPANPTWIPIKGLTTITFGYDSDTEDGSGADTLWGEPYSTKKNGSLSLEAKPILDSVTGARDPGQAELDHYVMLGGCEGDARLRISDPVGNSTIIDAIVTSREVNPDDTTTSVSWELEQVGEPEVQTYKQVTGVALKDGETAATTLAMTVGGAAKTITVAFTPADASNQKYGVASADETKVRVVNKDGLHFDVIPVAKTTGTVNVVVRSVNNSMSATLAVTVA